MARTVLGRSTMRAVTFAIVIGCVAATSHARAQGRTEAAELACPEIAESRRLEPSPSTLADLGSCYEKLGKTAMARATYEAAASLTAAQMAPASPQAAVTAEPATEPSRGSPQRTIGIVTTGVGIAGLVVGTVFLVRAKVKYDESREHCPFDKNLCYPEGVALRDDARTSGNIATFAYVASAAAIAAGVVLWITAPSSESRRGSIGVSPTASGLLVQGTF